MEGTSSVTGVSTPTGSGGVRDQEFEARIDSVKVGVWLSLIVSIGSALYALEMSQRLDMVARATIGREEPK